MKKVLSIFMFLVAFAATTFAQAADTIAQATDTILTAADSVIKTPAIIEPAQNLDGVAGAWATVLALYPAALHYAQLYLPMLLLLLVAVKLTVKAIPTPYAIKVAGPLDGILNFLTLFQKDIRSLSVALFIGLAFTLSSCGITQAVAQDCTVTTPVLTTKTQRIVIECTNLPADIMDKVRTELSKYVGK